jgi:hypothetical protein
LSIFLVTHKFHGKCEMSTQQISKRRGLKAKPHSGHIFSIYNSHYRYLTECYYYQTGLLLAGFIIILLWSYHLHCYQLHTKLLGTISMDFDITNQAMPQLRRLTDVLCWWSETSQNCGHQRAYCSPPRWYVSVESQSDSEASWEKLLTHPPELSRKPTSSHLGASRRNGRSESFFLSSIWNTSWAL